MAASLTLEVLLDGRWRKAARLEFPNEAAGDRGSCHFEYEHEFLVAHVDNRRFDSEVSLRLRQ